MYRCYARTYTYGRVWLYRSGDCTHTHDEVCGYVEAIPSVECNLNCADTETTSEDEILEETAATPHAAATIRVDGGMGVSGAKTTLQHNDTIEYEVIINNLSSLGNTRVFLNIPKGLELLKAPGLVSNDGMAVTNRVLSVSEAVYL